MRRDFSGATWSPNTVTYAGNNRTHMIRIPDAAGSSSDWPTAPQTRICCKPVLAAGLDGIEE